MLKRVGRILLGVLLISLMISSCVYVIVKNNNTKSNTMGTITLIVNNLEDEVVEKKRIEYKKEDTLFKVLDQEYNLLYQEGSYGHYITGISSDSFKVETNGKSSWIWFELAYLKDGKSYSDSINFNDYDIQVVQTGIDGIALKDNMIFALNERDATHSASIFDEDISINEEAISDLVFRILVYSISGIFIVGIIIFLIVNRRSKNKITVPEICILAFMTVLLFVQEELFTFIPNFQFTFLLLAVYVSVFGFKKTSLIVLAHVLLDNLFMGSLTPIVMIPMWMGYMLYIGVIWLLRNKRIWAIALGGSISVIFYCMFFLITNAIFLDIDVYIYWISDIPFEIMLIACTAFTLIYLYPPLRKKLFELWNKEEALNESFDREDQVNGEI